jgi:hypothetical protein
MLMMATATGLTKTDAGILAECEATIERGFETFVEVGNALLTIRESKLYRLTHDTFDAYCRERWGWSRVHAHRLIDASCVVNDLLPMGNKPTSERQARPLAELPKAERTDAWKEAVERSNGKPTAKVVEQVVRERKPRPEPSLADERPKMLSHGTLVNGQPAADPPDVAKARKAGLIPADAKVEIDEPDEINVDAVKEQTIEALGKEADLSDEEWLAKLPLHGRLQGVPLRCFELSALTYRYVDAERQAFHAKLKRTMKALRKNAPGVIEGEWESRVSYALRLKHPSDWLQCPPVDGGGCGGTGQVQLIGQCANCKGRGFLIR